MRSYGCSGTRRLIARCDKGNAMDARASQLIQQLGLVAHPEGGCFRQVYRSSTTVQPADDRGVRPSLTTIYFLLVAGEVSRWHRVASDEAWHYYEGDPLELWSAACGLQRNHPARARAR